MIVIRNASSLETLTNLAAEHHADAENARRRRDELDAQMKPLEEQLRKLADERAKWSRELVKARDLEHDMVGIVRQSCEDNGWMLPTGLPTADQPGEELPPPAGPAEAAARAATSSTQANPIPVLDDPDGEPDNGRTRPEPAVDDEPPLAPDPSGVHPVLGASGGGRG